MSTPAVLAFDAVAPRFDERFGAWASVEAQRRAVRRELLRAFPAGSRLLELGGGTGEDALFLARHGRNVLLTDGAPSMVAQARAKVDAAGMRERIDCAHMVLEDMALPAGSVFDGAFSNFASLNCVTDRAAVARELARVLRPGARALLVMFGPLAPGEVIVQLLRGDARAAFRRLARGRVHARLGGRDFDVDYPTPRRVARGFAPWFELNGTRGIGVFVPPSAAEPAISRMPRLLRMLESMDRLASSPLAWLGDHVLLDLQRTSTSAP